jgi:DNA-binding CsgD family transcriptional regulator
MPQGRLQSLRGRWPATDRPVARPRPAPTSERAANDIGRAPFSDNEIAARAARSLELWRTDKTGRGAEAFDRLLADMAHLPLVESYEVERSYRYVHRDTHELAPTPAQLRSLEQAARGLSAKEAATELGLSVHTIKSERAGARIALRAHSTTEAVATAIRRGLI